MNTRPSPIRRRGPGYGITWREKRPRPLTPEQEQALDAALDRLRREAVEEGERNDAAAIARLHRQAVGAVEEGERNDAAALARVRRQAVSGEGPANDT